MVARCADAGGDLGSRVVAARLVRDIMHPAFLIERQWPPYPKWLGTRFAHLGVAASAVVGRSADMVARRPAGDLGAERRSCTGTHLTTPCDEHATRSARVPRPHPGYALRRPTRA